MGRSVRTCEDNGVAFWTTMMLAAASASQKDNVRFFISFSFVRGLIAPRAHDREYGNSISHYQKGKNTGIELKSRYGLLPSPAS